MAALVGAAAVLVAAPPAATSCAPITDEDAFARADTVFVGTPTAHETGSRSEGEALVPTAWTFAVTAVHKGEAHAEQVVVTAWPEGPGQFARTSEPWLVFARNGPVPGRPDIVSLHSDVCLGSRPVADRPVPPSFGAARPPAPGRAGDVDLDGRAGLLLAGAALVTALAAAVVWWTAGRRRRR